MLTGVTFRVEGAKQIERAMRELGAAASNRIARSALNRSATPVVKREKELAPYGPGSDDPKHLRDSITKRLRRQRRGSSRQNILIGIERPKSRIAHLLEFGTRFMSAQPYLRPALDEVGRGGADHGGRHAERHEREIKKLAVRK